MLEITVINKTKSPSSVHVYALPNISCLSFSECTSCMTFAIIYVQSDFYIYVQLLP